MIIEMNGLAIEVIKKPIKNMHLRIYPPDGTVKVSAPFHFKEKTIISFLQKHRFWIETQRQRITQCTPVKEESFRTGSVIPFKGKSYTLIIQEHHGPSHVECQDHSLYAYLPHDFNLAQIEMLLEHWYKTEMQALLPSLINYWESVIRVKVKEWGIKKMKTRWGSCNTRAQRIWLNLNLIKKPTVCLEYVLVHELVHLLEASHNQRFYHLMNQFMPEWREYEYLLTGKTTRK